MNVTSTLNERKSAPPPWYAQRWPWLLIGGPLAVVIACAFTIYLAFSRQDAMVVDNYYMEGKAINQDLARDRAATALSLTAELHYDAADGRLNGKFLSFGAPVLGNILIHLAHASQPEKDLQFTITPDAHGNFTAALPMLEMTRWRVQIENERRDWRLLGIWKWPHVTSVAIKADLPS
ncbi:FixH family protein [Herbaspirillum sp. RTI4]|uniref:FixH family protein n=1 Tax=Herbaspirillum sp. RTI4 TaxID=3048640 RepID=UPI002AB3B0F1|nr:FixH family protein [Herbaspirillum sp. RTI4]MDY7578982.1 FixH family protein [Herbaspirillum sp. RTI4]MEA9980913.1 FixH family protein [Herbaspirillum sp. RTI4]